MKKILNNASSHILTKQGKKKRSRNRQKKQNSNIENTTHIILGIVHDWRHALGETVYFVTA
jgi:hypothetical protein